MKYMEESHFGFFTPSNQFQPCDHLTIPQWAVSNTITPKTIRYNAKAVKSCLEI